MTKTSKLHADEINRRAEEVFDMRNGEFVMAVYYDDESETVRMPMLELDDNDNLISFDYIPDMTDRPQALAYLMGEREDFAD